MKLFVIAAAALAATSVAQAQNWNESGDAGVQWGGAPAQDVTGVGALTSITGELLTDGDVDVFKIDIKDWATFSATTDNGFGTIDDSTLYIFDLAGNGIAKNDDVSGANFMSTLPAGNALYSSLAPGQYYLAISYFGTVPFSVNPPTSLTESIFDVFNFTGVVGPQTNPALTWFDASSAATANATYRIDLTGASFVPTPGALALLGMGGLLASRRRR